MRAFELDQEQVETITRIEFEPLGNGLFRWNLFAGTVRVHSEIGRPETTPAIFQTTAMFCTFPDEESDDAGTGPEADSLARGLD